jgi:hypothetical protein
MLRNVWTTKDDNSKQLEMLRELRSSLNISEDVHKKLEAEIKAEIAHESPSPQDENIMTSEMNLMIQESAEQPEQIHDEPSSNIAMAIPAPPIPTPQTLVTGSQELVRVKLKKNLTLGKEKYRNKDFEAANKYFNICHDLAPDNQEINFFIKKIGLKLSSHNKKTKNSSVKNTQTKSTTDQDPNPIETSQEKTTEQAPTAMAAHATPTISTPTSITSTTTSASTTSNEPAPAAAAVATAIPIDPSPNIEQVDVEGAKPSVPAAIPVAKPDVTSDPSTDEEKKSKEDSKENKNICVSCEGTGSCYWCNGQKHCDRCVGTGLIDNEPCPTCGGSGNCKSCQGTGKCSWCKGSGERNSRRLSLSIF